MGCRTGNLRTLEPGRPTPPTRPDSDIVSGGGTPGWVVRVAVANLRRIFFLNAPATGSQSTPDVRIEVGLLFLQFVDATQSTRMRVLAENLQFVAHSAPSRRSRSRNGLLPESPVSTSKCPPTSTPCGGPFKVTVGHKSLTYEFAFRLWNRPSVLGGHPP